VVLQANHRTNGAVGYTYHMRLQAFQLSGDAILDLLTDSPEAARLMERPIGVVAEGGRLVSWQLFSNCVGGFCRSYIYISISFDYININICICICTYVRMYVCNVM
jgi:hypothetical protein